MTGVLNLCLDLNVWCAAFLADRRGADDTAAQSLVRIARTGRAEGMPVQLVISWGMLTRLRKVLEIDWRVPRPTVDPIIEAIAGYARLGAVAAAPHLTLGGMGLFPIRDIEDAHVIETAIAGNAQLLVTANFDDFVTTKSRIVEPGRIAVVETATTRLVVAHPFRAAAWLGRGLFPDPNMIVAPDRVPGLN
ncbi:MAG: PIN domain-containing protein [Alphaproteobacteria bacterium]|nr:PIN domain-containing protein [Alphaproteobacteria bacterium]MBF0336188.1 PIN domain-containing protein [Alphaproteobacteria bacterium]